MEFGKLCLFLFVFFSVLTLQGSDAILDIFTLTPGAAVGGMVTGIIASTLGGISIAIALEKVEFVDPPEMMGYGYGERKRRSAKDVNEKLQAEKVYVEKFIDDIYERDQSQCIEKLVCDVTKRALRDVAISPDEVDILNVIEQNTNHGLTFKRMVMAQKVALGDGDCDFLFDSCPLHSSQMVEFISKTVNRVAGSKTNL